MKFNQAYTYLIQQLPPSLVEEAWRRLTTRKRNPFTLLEACGIDPAIEDFLQHEIIVYNRKKERQRRSSSPLENLSRVYNTEMTNQESQTQDTIPICTCDQRLMEYNEKTFGKFMREITIEYGKRVNENKKLRCEIEQQKIQLQETEKCLAYLKSRSIHQVD
ncbi:9807_t:CDS:2 [Entrophospora sp. SA101]|nr:9807_t:CDS:2 [Entrophospora sp. SA101]